MSANNDPQANPLQGRGLTGARCLLAALSALYALLAAWCTIDPHGTAASLGYELTTASGVCEYRVVYGGLELGLAVFFALGIVRRTLELPVLWLALILHAALALFRAPIVIMDAAELSPSIFAVFGLEILITAFAAWVTLPRGLP